MDKLELGWAKKFRELCDSGLTDKKVIVEFLNYCTDEEVALTKRWEEESMKCPCCGNPDCKGECVRVIE